MSADLRNQSNLLFVSDELTQLNPHVSLADIEFF
jgi:hypothetical protein